jgi:hypothetical protein
MKTRRRKGDNDIDEDVAELPIPVCGHVWVAMFSEDELKERNLCDTAASFMPKFQYQSHGVQLRGSSAVILFWLP